MGVMVLQYIGASAPVYIDFFPSVPPQLLRGQEKALLKLTRLLADTDGYPLKFWRHPIVRWDPIYARDNMLDNATLLERDTVPIEVSDPHWTSGASNLVAGGTTPPTVAFDRATHSIFRSEGQGSGKITWAGSTSGVAAQSAYLSNGELVMPNGATRRWTFWVRTNWSHTCVAAIHTGTTLVGAATDLTLTAAGPGELGPWQLVELVATNNTGSAQTVRPYLYSPTFGSAVPSVWVDDLEVASHDIVPRSWTFDSLDGISDQAFDFEHRAFTFTFTSEESAPAPCVYVHSQGTAAASWSIEHGLGTYPVVVLTDLAGNVLEADVQYIDADNVTVSFGTAQAGTAYLLYGGTTFESAQSSATTWTIAHGMGTHPAVVCVDAAGAVVEGDVQYVDADTVEISFGSAQAGTAYLVACQKQTFHQGSAATTWHVVGPESYPVVIPVDSAGFVVWAQAQYVAGDQVDLTFASAQTGDAYIA